MIDTLTQAAKVQCLDVFGILHARPQDNLGEGTIVLLGPDEPGFWDHFSETPEYNDGARDPMDRWSSRVITKLAKDAGGTPLFPFGLPARPFIGWAMDSGQAFVSPASLLVNARVGMFLSFRGAVLLPDLYELPPKPANPCDTCADKPCLKACPPRALTDQGYDLPACHDFLNTADGAGCMSRGCAVRRSCPLARNYPRMDAQSAYHMKVFHP